MDNSSAATNSREMRYIVVIALVAVAIMLPILLFGLPYGHDLPHHYQCASTYYESILNFDLYPSWSLFRNFGYGGMETRLYPPISHYSLAVVYLLTGNWHIASWIVFTLFAFIGGLGVYLWAREYMPPWPAVFAGCIYILLPYHLNQLYNTFFYAEFVGSSVLPFLFVFTSRVCRRGRAQDVAGLSIAYAVLILTHLPLTVIGSISCAVYGLVLLKRIDAVRQLTNLALGVVGGLAASSFFWVKVVQEKDLMAKANVYADPWLDYRLNFLLTPIQTYSEGIATEVYNNGTYFYDMMLFYALLVVVGCMLPSAFAGLRSEKRRADVWLLLVLAVFLSILPSKFVWDLVTPLQEVQFPWRWLAVVCIAAPVLAAGRLDSLLDAFKTKRRPLALIGLGCVFASITFSVSQIIRPAPFIEKEKIEQRMNDNSRDIGFTFWWPIWVRKEALDIREEVQAGDRRWTIETWTATQREFSLSRGDGTEKARIATFYHPNWKAAVNGAPAEIKPDQNGAILVTVPAEDARIALTFTETPQVKAAQVISLLAWLILAIAYALSIRRK
jgi:hypothetical protein